MTSAAALYQELEPNSVYYDRHSGNQFKKTLLIIGLQPDEYKDRLKQSTTLYVGNLSFFTYESQLMEFFSECGQVVSLIMGLNKREKTPCGFCFVEYATRDQAQQAVDCLNLQSVDGRQIRIDWDPGFKQGRQFGRGKSGGQVRDELNADGLVDKDRPVNRYSAPPHGGAGERRGGGYQQGRFNSGYRNFNKRGRIEVEEEDTNREDDMDRRKRFRRNDDM